METFAPILLALAVITLIAFIGIQKCEDKNNALDHKEKVEIMEKEKDNTKLLVEIESHLFKIARNTDIIRRWVVFFGFASIIGVAVWCIIITVSN